MNKSKRFEMRVHPDKLSAYKKLAAMRGISLSAWFEFCADKEVKKENILEEYKTYEVWRNELSKGAT